MKKLFLILFALVTGFGISFAQDSEITLNYNSVYNYKAKYLSVTDVPNSFILSTILFITPTIVLDNSKVYFGLSKELSAGKYPYGRAEFDYTYIFRNERTSALHLSYNIDIPLNGNFKDPSVFMISPGAGYYTDLTRNGFFGQLSIGLFASTGFSNAVSIHPNIKFRKVFMKDSLPGMFEVSLGVGFGLYSR